MNAEADGLVRFSPLLFTKAKLNGKDKAMFHYSVRERDTGARGVTYDDHVAAWTITVTDDNSGQLKAAVTADKDHPVAFTNTYKAQPVTVSFRAHKTLADPGNMGVSLKRGQFSFTCVDEETGKQVGTTASNDAQGDVRFAAIHLSKPGVYKYVLSEVKGSLVGVAYDSAKHHATVAVTDDGEGRLLADVKYDGGDTVPEFTNTYKVQGVLPGTGSGTQSKQIIYAVLGVGLLLAGASMFLAVRRRASLANR